MLIVRPVRASDLGSLLELAALTGFGLTTLPRDGDFLAERIAESEESFRRMTQRARGESYLFVMEDPAAKRVVGTCGIVSKVGGFEPFYTYRVQTSVHHSEMLHVHKEIKTLTLVVEHSGPCEIGSLFLHPEYRKEGNGRLLSLSRFLFIAQHRQRFEPVVLAEMRGVIDDAGGSPFWNAVGKHFFEIDFPKADYLSVVNKRFIADLMPRHPIYVPLLPEEAQAVIGQVHPQTLPALKLLQSEGFRISDMVDIFEAGPVVTADRDEIRTVRESREAVVEGISPVVLEGERMHILNPRVDCRTCRGVVEVLPSGHVRVDAATAKALDVHEEETIRYAPAVALAREEGLP
jgi:arginine N-succinyltransferase